MLMSLHMAHVVAAPSVTYLNDYPSPWQRIGGYLNGTNPQVFRWHIGAVQLLLKDGVGFLCTSRMPTPLHKMFGLDSLTYYIQAVGGFFIILM